MHRLLARQVRKAFGEVTPESLSAECRRLLDLVDENYARADADRTLLERSMELSSGELLSRNQALLTTNKQLSALREASLDAIIDIDQQGMITAFNQAAENTFGYQRADAIGRKISDLILSQRLRPGDEGGIAEGLAIDESSARGKRIEVSALRADGSEFLAELTPIAIQGEAAPLLTAYVRDITEQKHAEQALREAEQKFRSIFENATEGIFQTTREGQYRAANPALARIFGYASPEDLIGCISSMDTQIYVDPLRRSQFVEAMARDHAVEEFEAQVRRKDGEIIWISLTARSIRDPQGALLYYEGTVIDITIRKRSEAEREELQSRLVAVSRQSGMAEVATGVLHNVGNVLNSVNVSASLVTEKLRTSKIAQLSKAVGMLRDQPVANWPHFLTEDAKGKILPAYFVKVSELLTTEQNEVLTELSVLAENIEHIKQIVNMQQSYAKVAGVTEKVRLQDLLEDAIRLDAPSLERHKVAIVREYESIPPVTLDKHRVLQILVNLLSNAKQSVNEHDLRLREAGAASGPKRITLRLARGEAGRVLVQVTDTGTGIAPENLARIFSLGFTTKREGHGFGLHTSALAARTMGGSLTASSRGMGTGATFSLELDVKEMLPAGKES